MELKGIAEKEYTPEWNNNKQETEPIVAVLKPLTAQQRTQVMNISISDEGKAEVKPDLCAAVRYGVKELRNYKEDGKPIKDGNRLLTCTAPGIDGLVRELGMQIITENQQLAETEAKN